MTHAGVEEARPFFEATERIPRSVELPWHRHDVGVPVVLHRPHIGSAERLGSCLEANAVARRGHTRDLPAHAIEPVKIHDDTAILVVDVYVG